MAQDPHLTNLLKWSIENSTSNPSDPSDPSQPQPPSRPLDPAALNTLFGGPSDAELMQAAMFTILSPSSSSSSDPNTPTASHEDKLTAFDNLEQLVENIDNANNLAPLGLWTPLIGLLSYGKRKGGGAEEEGVDPEHSKEMRRMAAWCLGTAVQNNRDAQERALVSGAAGVLVGMLIGKNNTNDRGQGDSTEGRSNSVVNGTEKSEKVGEREEDQGVRRKARYAVSSLVRNYQPGMDEMLRLMGASGAEARVDAGDMEAVDGVLERLMR